MSARHLETGKSGEDAAEKFLKNKGYRILDRNVRIGGGELDIVCSLKKTIVFVEVKTRDENGPALPGEALTKTKMSRLVKAAGAYLSEKNLWDRQCRFDLVAVTAGNKGFVLEHHPNVFDLSQAVDSGHAPWQPW